MEKTEQTIKIINAIGEQWPFLITIFVIVVIIIKWKSIWSGLDKFKKIRFRKGDAEVELNRETAIEEGQIQPSIENISKPKDNNEKEEQEVNTLFDCYLRLGESKKEEAQKVFEQVQSSADESDKFQNEVVFNYYKFLHGDISSIETLLIFNSEENISNSNKYYTNYYLGYCYRHSNNKDLAIKYFSESEKLAKGDKQKTDCTVNIANVYLENEFYDEAILKLLAILKHISENSSIAEIYKNISAIYKKKGIPKLRFAFLEKAIAVYPNDTLSLFNLAYDYSDNDYEDASLLHYLNLLSFKPNHSMALNNIGYGFSKKEMQFNAVNYYKKAIDHSNTLAVGNLCFKYINEGFKNEAEELIEKYKNEKELNQMVIRAQDEVLNINRKEEEKLLEIKKIGKKHSEFFQFYSESILHLESLKSYNSNEWIDNEQNEILVSINNYVLTIKWKKYNDTLKSDDEFEVNGKLGIYGCDISFKIPETIKPSLFSSFQYSDKKEPYRSIKTYSGQCSIDIERGTINILYKEEKVNKFKTITKKPSA